MSLLLVDSSTPQECFQWQRTFRIWAKPLEGEPCCRGEYPEIFAGTSSTIGSEFINERIPARQREAQRIQQAVKTFAGSSVR